MVGREACAAAIPAEPIATTSAVTVRMIGWAMDTGPLFSFEASITADGSRCQTFLRDQVVSRAPGSEDRDADSYCRDGILDPGGTRVAFWLASALLCSTAAAGVPSPERSVRRRCPVLRSVVLAMAAALVLPPFIDAARADATSALKCRQTISKELAKFVKTKSSVLRKCKEGAVKNGVPASPVECPLTPQDDKINAAAQKLMDKIAAGCGGANHV
jgi:hypothetical protein